VVAELDAHAGSIGEADVEIVPRAERRERREDASIAREHSAERQRLPGPLDHDHAARGLLFHRERLGRVLGGLRIDLGARRLRVLPGHRGRAGGRDDSLERIRVRERRGRSGQRERRHDGEA
jgi:hypothetical protein